jgi:DNA invertase Pin-like site-specific DNA recombinase
MLAIYERVSSNHQNLQGQHRELEHWAKSQAESVHWFRDKFTGKSMNRPGFDQLMSLVRQGKVSKIVVWRLDRLGRTIKGLVDLMAELMERKVTLVSLSEAVAARQGGRK